MFNGAGDATFEFGVGHRNTVLWSPHGRFLCLGVRATACSGMRVVCVDCMCECPFHQFSAFVVLRLYRLLYLLLYLMCRVGVCCGM